MASTRYVDFSAANNGDGTAANQAASGGAAGAYNTLVAITLTASDTVWIRRAGTLTLAAAFTNNAGAGITYIGWPISTDEDFSTRPASGTSNGWDADSTAVIATINFAAATSNFIITISTGATFKRIKFNQTEAGSTFSAINMSAGSSCTFKYVQFISAQTNQNLIFLTTSVGSTSFYSCSFIIVGATTGLGINSTVPALLFDCTFSKTAPNTGTLLSTTGLTGQGEINRCTFTVADKTAVSTSCISIVNTQAGVPLIFNDCILDNSVNSGFGVNIATLSGQCIVNNMSTKGSPVSIGSASIIPIGQFGFSQILQTLSQATGGITSLANSGFLFYAANYTAAPGNTTNDITLNNDIFTILANPIFANPSRIGGSPPGALYYGDLNGVLGAFESQNLTGIVRSNWVNRSGGDTYSLRFEYSDGAIPPKLVPLEMGLPGMETIFVSLGTGTNTITMYGAYQGYVTPPTNNDIWFDTTYLSAVSGPTCKGASSSATTALVSDTSTWTGAGSSFTSFKIVLTVQTAQACACPIRIKFRKNDPNGITYLDPTPIIT